MKNFITIYFLLSSIPVFSCICTVSSFCEYYELATTTSETTLIFKGSYLSEENYGEIVTESSVHYIEGSYVNTDSTVWVMSGGPDSCIRFIGDKDAIFIVRYITSPPVNEFPVRYACDICFTDYLPISENDEVTGRIYDPSEVVTISLAELEEVIEQGCVITSTLDAADDVDQVKIYPNPVSDKLTIECNAALGEVIAELYDTKGNLIKTSESYSIDMNDLSSGVYFVKVSCQASYFIEKIIKY